MPRTAYFIVQLLWIRWPAGEAVVMSRRNETPPQPLNQLKHISNWTYIDDPRYESDEFLQVSFDQDSEEEDLGSLEGRLLVVPDKKFAFCYIEKVACRQFNQLLNKLNGIKTPMVNPYRYSIYKKMGVDIKDITQENGWFLGVFLREPTDRFLSAHRSKCETRGGANGPVVENGGKQCLGDVVPGTSNRSVLRTNFHHSVDLLMGVNDIGNWNAHYAHQKVFCGGIPNRVKDKYNYVGYLAESYQYVQDQVRDMLFQAGIDWNDHFSNLFPSEMPLNIHNTDAWDKRKLYYRNETDIQRVKAHFEDDYSLGKLNGV